MRRPFFPIPFPAVPAPPPPLPPATGEEATGAKLGGGVTLPSNNAASRPASAAAAAEGEMTTGLEFIKRGGDLLLQ